MYLPILDPFAPLEIAVVNNNNIILVKNNSTAAQGTHSNYSPLTALYFNNFVTLK